jgi:phospholipid/cholesterol/gamma-HCH transport system substrate-binding protein
MQTSRTVEILVGVFIALGMAAFFMLAMKVSNITAFTENDTYKLQARFDNIGGLKERSPVRISGVRIGRVDSISYDDDQLEAIVSLRINSKHQRIPDDSTASIYTAGLLGEQYISLEPGGSEEYFVDGDIVDETQSAFVLERMVGKFLIQEAESSER